MKFLVCGLGSIGQRHYLNLKQLRAGDIIVYRTQKGCNKDFIDNFSKEHNPKVFYDFDEALAQKPDAVVITNPTAFHLETAKKAIESGAHVFLEKPLSHDMKGVEELISLAKKKNLVGYVGYNFRFHPLLQQMKKWLDSGKIGRALSAHAEIGEYLPDWHSWEDYLKTYAARADLGGGVILTQSHDIDYLYWFFGMPKQVVAFENQDSELKIEVDSVVDAIFQFGSGVTASLHMDYVKRPSKRRFEITGSKGRMIWDYQDKTLVLIPFEAGSQSVFVKEPAEFERNSMFLDETKQFISCIEKKENPLISLEQGAEVLKIALTMKDSIKNKKVIQL
ncbi:MAG: Gfo/Idh/MocA family oxidoreductase [Patescibacteria group bacterium]